MADRRSAALLVVRTPKGERHLSGSPQAFWCTHRDGYAVIAFPAELATAHMAEVRDAGLQIIEQLSTVREPACLVDLSALDYMGSSLVASVVRIWKAVKAQNGRMVVVSSNERITDILRATGLTKVWTIVGTFEEGVHALGCSPEAKVEKRERRLLTFVGPLALAGAVVAAGARLTPALAERGQPPFWMMAVLCGLAFLSAGISLFRERGWQRGLSGVIVLLTPLLAGMCLWKFGLPVPESGTVAPAPGGIPPGMQWRVPAARREAEAARQAGAEPQSENLAPDLDQTESAAEPPAAAPEKTQPAAPNNPVPDNQASAPPSAAEQSAAPPAAAAAPADAAPANQPPAVDRPAVPPQDGSQPAGDKPSLPPAEDFPAAAPGSE